LFLKLLHFVTVICALLRASSSTSFIDLDIYCEDRIACPGTQQVDQPFSGRAPLPTSRQSLLATSICLRSIIWQSTQARHVQQN